MSEDKIYTVLSIRPIFDRVIVEPQDPDYKTESGIILPPSTEIPVLKGVVKAIGFKVSEVKVGDDVIFNALSGSPYMVGEKPYLLMRENDLIAIV